MTKYHKIQTVYKRDKDNNFKTLLVGEYSLPCFEYLAENEWVFTEKVDGTNIRVMWDGENITYGGRTDNAQIPATLYSRLTEIFGGKESVFFDKFGHGKTCLYGEGHGAKIQKGGGNYCTGQDFVLFDVLAGEWWLKRADVVDVSETFNIGVVPVIGRGTLGDMCKMAQGGIVSNWGDFRAEGIVARPEIELKTRGGERIITKIKCKDFQ
ncbi:RNA ligase family protein [Pseudomonadales bacterium]|nr:RNA ligase family protein [Pseudomonadales bacterium]